MVTMGMKNIAQEKKGATMTDYIKREDAIDIYKPYADRGLKVPVENIISNLEDVPSADVVERKRGGWIVNGYTSGGATVYECSVCNGEVDEMPTGLWGDLGFIYCPYCGASMEQTERSE